METILDYFDGALELLCFEKWVLSPNPKILINIIVFVARTYMLFVEPL